MKQDTRIILLILLGLLTGGLAVKTCSLQKKTDDLYRENARLIEDHVKKAEARAAVLPPPHPAPSADPAEEADLRHHHAAIDRCSAEHRLAVIGYGWRIVCLDPKFVAWHEDPLTGHDPGGL